MNRWIRISAVALGFAAMGLASGCATSGRYIALKEYQANAPARANSPLQGKSVHIARFAYAPVKPAKGSMPAPLEPAGYSYVKLTEAQEELWDRDVKALRANFTKSEASWIGAVRNGYGMVLSGVYMLNDPGEWLRDCLAREVAAQGAKVVENEAEADVTVSGTISWLYVDAYMKVWADLLASVSVKARGQAATEATYHTVASQGQWSSSAFEFYQPIRQCQQKLALQLLTDLGQAVQR